MHRVPKSVFLFMFLGSLECIKISSFSVMHTSHDFWPGLYGVHCFNIFHLMVGLGFNFLSHTYWANVVAFLFACVLKLYVWLASLVLKSVHVMPT